jgi:hypothetical protein
MRSSRYKEETVGFRIGERCFTVAMTTVREVAALHALRKRAIHRSLGEPYELKPSDSVSAEDLIITIKCLDRFYEKINVTENAPPDLAEMASRDMNASVVKAALRLLKVLDYLSFDGDVVWQTTLRHVVEGLSECQPRATDLEDAYALFDGTHGEYRQLVLHEALKAFARHPGVMMTAWTGGFLLHVLEFAEAMDVVPANASIPASDTPVYRKWQALLARRGLPVCMREQHRMEHHVETLWSACNILRLLPLEVRQPFVECMTEVTSGITFQCEIRFYGLQFVIQLDNLHDEQCTLRCEVNYGRAFGWTAEGNVSIAVHVTYLEPDWQEQTVRRVTGIAQFAIAKGTKAPRELVSCFDVPRTNVTIDYLKRCEKLNQPCLWGTIAYKVA